MDNNLPTESLLSAGLFKRYCDLKPECMRDMRFCAAL
jgi:hypothetical protein